MRFRCSFLVAVKGLVLVTFRFRFSSSVDSSVGGGVFRFEMVTCHKWQRYNWGQLSPSGSGAVQSNEWVATVSFKGDSAV